LRRCRLPASSVECGGPGSLVGAEIRICPRVHPECSMISVENIIGLVGGVALVIYLFVALTHPEWF
jgi:K+-transporting ATPase KdpF subunit